MKKRILVVALALILVCGAIGGTAAYYVHESQATNVITSGSIKAVLQEWADLKMQTPYTDPTGVVMPSQSVTKVITVENTGANEAWIRVKLTLASQGDKLPETVTDYPVTLDIDAEAWTLKDGWYYYNSKLQPGTRTEPLFTSVTFDTDMNDDWQGAHIYIDAAMEATQVAYNGDHAWEAIGWPTTP